MSPFTIEIDATKTSFSKFFIPCLFDAARVSTLALEPGRSGFKDESGVQPAFEFQISNSGEIYKLTPESARALKTSFEKFFIPGAFDATKVQTLALQPGRFGFQVQSEGRSALEFQVSNSGEIYQLTPESASAFVDGVGTSRLTVTGFDVTLDAQCLSTGVLLENTETDGHFHALRTLRLLPGRYAIQDISGGRPKIPFDLDDQGTVTLTDPADAGVAAIRGTSTIKYFGFPVLIDARNVDQVGGNRVDGVGISANNELIAFNISKVLFVTLLPGDFEVSLTSGVEHSGIIFSIDQMGNLGFDPTSGNNSSLQIQRITIPALRIVGTEEPCPLP